MSRSWRVAWITGASSGIGADLAVALARRGVQVAVSARRRDELEVLAARQPGILPYPLDVTDVRSCREVAGEIGRLVGPIDLAVLNAGVGRRMGLADFDPDRAAQMMAVNYQGVVNTLAPLMPAMRDRGQGHIALVASLAGYRGFPRAAGYSASKAAVINLAQSLRGELEAAGITLSVVNPGYVATPMTASAGRALPWLIESEDAAGRIVRGLERGRREIAFPWQTALAARTVRAMPDALVGWLARITAR